MDYFRAMIKYLFIVINSLSLFFLSLFGGDAITVTNNIPTSMAAGQEVSVELKINKGSMTGFALLQLELPEGISVKESEEKGASYSYEAGMAKWTWTEAPADNEILVKVILITAESAAGIKDISAKYSYVENNNKQTIDMEPVHVTVRNTGASNALSNSEPPGKISVERTITKNSDSEFLINLKIKKGITKGFAKYIDDVVGQLQTRSIKTDGGSFSVADGKIKFVWVNVPEKEELEVSYTLSGVFDHPIILNGEYSYLENNQSKKFVLNPDTVKPSPVAPKEEMPETNLPVISQKDSALTEVKQPDTKKTEESVEQLSTDVTPKTHPDAITEKKEGKMNFSVQIGAFTNGKVSNGQLKKLFGINESIKSEMQGGFSKFMVGSHSEYKSARLHRENIKNNNGVKGAFVVAYNEGKRITVQEALMASNQKWFK